MRERFTGTSGVLPQNVRITLKFHMQDFSPVADTGSNKQAFSIPRPNQREQIAPTLYPNLLQYLSV